MLKYWVWLSELKGLRNQTRLALLHRFGDPERIFYAEPEELRLTEGADPGQLRLLENHDLTAADRILGGVSAAGHPAADPFRRRLSRAAEEHLRPAGAALL